MRSCLLIALAGAGLAVEYRLPRHQTIAREDDWAIPSISQDVRAPMSAAMPGLGLRDWGQIELGWRMHRPYWEEAVPEQRRQEPVHALEARLRLRVTPWLAAEFHGGGMMTEGDRFDYDFRDLEALTAITIYQDRYRGASLVLGVGMPAGTGAEPPDGHVSDYTSPTYIGEWRMTESIGFHVVHLNAAVRWNPSAEAELQSPLLLEDATIPADERHEVITVRADARLGWTWRASRWWRAGIEATYALRSTDFEATEERWRDREFLTAVFGEFNAGRNVAIKGTFGADPSHFGGDDGGVRCASVLLLTRF